MNIKHHPLLWMIIAHLCIGTLSVSSKIALQYFDPLLYGGLRALISAAAVAILTWHFVHKPISQNAFQHLLINSALYSVFVWFFFIGLDNTQAINAAVLGLLTPVFIYIGSILFLKEPFIRRSLFGAILSLVGGLILVGLPIIETGEFSIESGDGFILLSLVSLSAMILHTKKLYASITPHQVLTYRMLISGGVIVLLSMWQQESFDVSGVPATGWFALLYASVIVGGVGLLIFYASLKYIKAEDSAVLFYIDPLVGVLASAWILGETLSQSVLVAASIIIAGVILTHPEHLHRAHFYHLPPHKENILRRLLDSSLHKLHLK